jgi:flagellar basal body-associated protein FliL
LANLSYNDAGAGAPSAKSKRGLIIGIVVAAMVVLALAGAGVTWLLSKSGGSASDFAVNSCVKKSDAEAVSVSCSTDGAYQIVSKVETVDKCPDRNQPFVVLRETGKPDQVLCLKPAK